MRCAGHWLALLLPSNAHAHNNRLLYRWRLAVDAGSDKDSDEEEAEERWRNLLAQDGAEAVAGQSPPTFKRQRVQALLANMLALEQPVITVNMIDFLLQDGVVELLVAFITQLREEEQQRDGDGVLLEYADRRAGGGAGSGAAGRGGGAAAAEDKPDDPPPALLTSHRAVSLIASEEPTDALLTFLGQCAGKILSELFDCFDPCAAGNFFHACTVIERLAQQHTEAVYEVIGASLEATQAHLGRILQHVECPPVGETASNLICPPPATFNQRHWSQRSYEASHEATFAYYRALSQFRLLGVIVTHVIAPEHTDAHALAAADLLRELLRRLSINDHGEILLAPLGHCPEVLGGLLDCAIATDNPDVTAARRTACMDILVAVLQSCMEDEIAGPAAGPYETFGGTTTNMVRNRLANFSPEILDIFRPRFVTLCDIIASEHRRWLRQKQQVADGTELGTIVRHGSFKVPAAFSHYRICVIGAVVTMAQANVDLLKQVTTDVWRALVSWFIELPHCNLFHNLFFTFLMTVLRSNNTSSLKVGDVRAPVPRCARHVLVGSHSLSFAFGHAAGPPSRPLQMQALLQEQKLVTLLHDAYLDPENKSNIGHIVKCSNAIRLQASTLPPTAFLRIFLRSHDTWQKFLPVLCERTKADLVPGLGVPGPR